MAVKKKAGQRGKGIFTGIVVSAASKADAVSQYVSVANNQGAQVLSTPDGKLTLATLESHSGSFRNVVTGNGNMVKTSQPLVSNSSANKGDAEVEYTRCIDGCQSHIIADSLTSISHCPTCSEELRSLSAEEIEDLESAEMVPELGNQGLLVHASTFEEAEELLREVMDEESGTQVSLSDAGATDDDGNLVSQSSASKLTFVSHSSCDIEFSPFFGDATVSESSDAQAFKSVSASVKLNGDTAEVNYFQCCSSTCGQHVLATEDTPAFCPSCSNVLLDPSDVEEVKASLSSNEEDDFGDDDDEIDLDFGHDDDDEDEDEDDFVSESSGMAKVTFGNEGQQLASVSMSDDDEDDDFDLDDEDDEDYDDEDDLDLDDEDEDDLDLDDEDYDDEDEFVSESSVDLSLMTALSRSSGEPLDPKLVMLSYVGDIGKGDTWAAFYNQMPIALANVHSVDESVRSIFGTEKFKMAALASTRENGVEEGLTAIGFEPLNPDLDIPAVVSATVMEEAQAKVEAAQADTQTQIAQLNERFGAALATAAMGINRNAIKGASNPVRDNLIASLSAAGISNAEQLVNNAFASHSDTYSKILISQASAIVAKPLEVQNSLAETISNINFTSESSGASDIGVVTKAPQQQQLSSQSSVTSPASAPAAGKDFAALLKTL